MLFKVFITIGIFLFISVTGFSQNQASIEHLIKLKKGYSFFKYPVPRSRFSNFSILVPGLPVVTLDGGLFVCGVNKWLSSSTPGLKILSSATVVNNIDTSLLVVKSNMRTKKILVQKTRSLLITDSVSTIIEVPYGIYDIKVPNTETFYLSGLNVDGFVILKSNYKTSTSLFNSYLPIVAFDYIDENSFLVATDSSIIQVGVSAPPKEIIRLDLKISGVAIDRHADGAIYVSTNRGILRFNSTDEGDFDIITEEVNGLLTVYQDKLYIQWCNRNGIVAINLR